MDATYSYSYSYDQIGNRVAASEAGVPWTYTTNSLNQYTSATESNVQLDFAYDLDGSMTYRPVDGTSGWTQVWNGENRMVETYKGTDRLTFTYDYMGRRVEKCVYSGNTLVSKTYYVYDGFKCVEELDALDNNAVTLRHVWQPFDVGLDVILATTDSSGTSYFLHDANKNVMQKTSANGTLQETYVYAPFGGNVGTYSPHIGFSSENSDYLKLKLSYYNFRYYLYSFGRWNSRDKLNEKYENNLYSICSNGIIDKYDLLGNMTNEKCKTINNIRICWGQLEDEDFELGGTKKSNPIYSYGYIVTPPQGNCPCLCNNKILYKGKYFLSQKKREYNSSDEWEIDGSLDYLEGGKKANISKYKSGSYIDTPGLKDFNNSEPDLWVYKEVYKKDFRIELWCRCPPHMGGEVFTSQALQFHFVRFYNRRGELYSSIKLDFF